jgi:hypothetical protein
MPLFLRGKSNDMVKLFIYLFICDIFSFDTAIYIQARDRRLIHSYIINLLLQSGNRNNSSHPEELQKSIITTTSNTPTNVDTTNKVQNNNSNSNYNSKGINITQNRFRGFRSIRM